MFQNWSWEGPFTTLAGVRDESGVYLIFTHPAGSAIQPLDIGQAENIRAQLASDERRDQWVRDAAGAPLLVGVLYLPGMSELGRVVIDRQLREQVLEGAASD
jgi:hypothetical protein